MAVALWTTLGSPPPTLAQTPQAPPIATPHTPITLTDFRGDVTLKRANTPDFLAVTSPGPLGRRDEIQTHTGTAVIALDPGRVLELSPGSLLALIGTPGGADAYLARGALRIRAGDGMAHPHAVHLATAAGRVLVRSRDARIRVSDSTTAVALYEGSATLQAQGTVTLHAGQAAHMSHGEPPTLPQLLLQGPQWGSSDALYLMGETPVTIRLRWQPVPGAVSYHVEVNRTDGHPQAALETESTTAELHDLPLGSYLCRIAAVGDQGEQGELNEPRRVLIAGLQGLSPSGTATVPAGTLPKVLAPAGLGASMTIDGEPPPELGLRTGPHRVLVTIAGVSAEATALVPGPRTEPEHETPPHTPPAAERPAPQPAEQPSPAQPHGTAIHGHRSTPPFSVDHPADATTGWAGPVEDVALGGPGDVPGAILSPWAGRLAQLRLESTAQGWARLALQGRFTLHNGLGLDLSFSALRAALGGDNQALSGPTASVGDLTLGVRTPALRGNIVAVQGAASVVAPTGQSGLDTSLAENPGPPVPLTHGWRINGMLLLGLRTRSLSLHLEQGLSLRITGGLSPAYEGGLAVHAHVISRLYLIGMAQWSVHFLDLPGAITTDVGGAVGGGFEAYLRVPGVPAHHRLRLALLGRAGIGGSGAALYGRGTTGLQIGYTF